MLDPAGDDVITLVARGEERALERKIVCLAAAACEHDLIVVTGKQCCNLAARRGSVVVRAR